MPRRPEAPDVPVHLKLSLTTAEVFALTGLSDSSVRRLVADGKLARVPDTERVLIPRIDLDRWLAGRPREIVS